MSLVEKHDLKDFSTSTVQSKVDMYGVEIKKHYKFNLIYSRLFFIFIDNVHMTARAFPIPKDGQFQVIRFTVSRFASIDTSKPCDLIRQKRLEKGWFQAELAEKLRVPEDTIYNWENEGSMPEKRYLDKLFTILDI